MRKQFIQRQLALLSDDDLNALGLVRKAVVQKQLNDCSKILREGRVLLLHKHKNEVVKTQDLGRNTLTYPFRVIVAKILARKEAQVQAVVGTSSFPNGKDGFDYNDPVFPVRLYVGTGATPSAPTDTQLDYYLTESDTLNAAPVYFDLSRVIVQDAKSEYDALFESINVAFEFDIPAGTLRQGVDAEATPYLLREFGLFNSAGGDNHPIEGAPAVIGDPQVPSASPSTLLARKVADVVKLFEMSFTVRWEIRT